MSRSQRAGLTVQPASREPLEDSRGNYNEQVLSFETQMQEKNEYIIKLEK